MKFAIITEPECDYENFSILNDKIYRFINGLL